MRGGFSPGVSLCSKGGVEVLLGQKKKSVFWQNRRADHIRKTKFLAHLSLGVPKINYMRRRTYFLHNRRADHIRNTCFFAHLLSGVPKNQLLKKNRCVDHITNTRILVHLLLGVPKISYLMRSAFWHTSHRFDCYKQYQDICTPVKKNVNNDSSFKKSCIVYI